MLSSRILTSDVVLLFPKENIESQLPLTIFRLRQDDAPSALQSMWRQAA